MKTGEYEIDGLQDWSVIRALYNTVVPEVGTRFWLMERCLFPCLKNEK